MSNYHETPYRIRASQLDPAFSGDPQAFFSAIVALMSVVAPDGVYGIVVSASAPATNVGLWLRDGTKPYVWDETTNRYVPLDLSDSLAAILTAITSLQATTGTHTTQIAALQAADIALGLRTTTLEGYAVRGRLVISFATPAEADRGALWVQTNSGGTAVTAIKFWDGTAWQTVIAFSTAPKSYQTEVSARVAIPATGAKVEFTHGFSVAPISYSIGILCTNVAGNVGYSENDYIPAESVRHVEKSESDVRPLASYCNSSVLGVVRTGSGAMGVVNKSTGEIAAITESFWKVVGRASI
jgi:hypothetical protein